MRMTLSEYQALLARQRAKRQEKPSATVSSEAETQSAIVNECKRRGWLVFTGSMAHRTYRTLGEPDLTILADKGRVLFIEVKSGRGKRTPEQQAIATVANDLGHTIHLVRSLAEFVKLI